MSPSIPSPPPAELLERLLPAQREAAQALYLVALGTALAVSGASA